MINENLKKFRMKKGLSRIKLEEKAGISRRTIEFIEKRKIANPRLITLRKLAAALDVTINDLIE